MTLKRILAVVLAAVMVVALVPITAGAATHTHSIVKVPAKAPTCTEAGWNAYEYCTGCDYTTYVDSTETTQLFSDDFDAGFKPVNWVTDLESCHFMWDRNNGCIYGYKDAVFLQSNFLRAKDPKMWSQFYTSFDFQIRDFDYVAGEEERNHYVGIWYRDLFEGAAETKEIGCVYVFLLEIETGRFFIEKSHYTGWTYEVNGVNQSITTKAIIAETVIEDLNIQLGNNAPWYELGIRVTSGKLECYFERELVFSLESDPEATKYGNFTLDTLDDTVGSQCSPILFYNDGNYIALDNFRVMSTEYKFRDVQTDIPATGHSLVAKEEKAPTCTEGGWEDYYYCENCDYTEHTEIPATGHTLTQVEGKASTCTEGGWKAYEECSVCDYTTYVETPATGHSITQVEAKAPTCTEVGYEAYEKCGACDYTTYTEIPATDHTPSTWIVLAQPTETSDGLRIKSCTVCGTELQREVIPKHAHEIIKVEAKPVTCTESGYGAYEYCDACDYTTYAEIPATGHSLDRVNGKLPTCTEIGWEAYEKCRNCEYTTYEEIPATGHGETEIRDTVEPTADTEGYTGDTYCKACGEKIAEGEVLPKLSTPGDVNRDSAVNVADATALLKYIAKWNIEIDTDAADVNDDGNTNVADVTLILKYIAKWDIELK